MNINNDFDLKKAKNFLLTENYQIDETEIKHLIDLDIEDNYSNQDKLIDFLSKYVTKPDIYQTNHGYWEDMLFDTYDKWVNTYQPDKERIESAPDQKEWDSIHNEMQDNYNYNYFVRNFSVGDEEDTRHEGDIHQDIQYFINKYDVSNDIAMIMKKLVDEYLAPSLGYK
jgi:hypothetical protein